MKLQLILENQEVELNEKVSIPLNKTYENLNNPTDIIVDYSKSINIPMTSKNNEILSNSYRLDRSIIGNTSNSNIGIYLDPTKKIPMKLLYNSQVVLDGYAKFVSANNSTKNSYYTLNLFGMIGEIFQKLKSVVLSTDQLSDEQKAESDGGAKYVLNDRLDYNRFLNADYVADSWERDINNVYGVVDSTDVIGFAPSYRGYYNEFNSSQIQLHDADNVADEDKTMDISTYLTAKWKETYKTNNPTASDSYSQSYAEGLGADNIVGDGMKDYQMREYRSYFMKPYIYFNQLLQMFQEHIANYTDYKLELDNNWFNINNPYWTRMCYMLDFIDSRDSNIDSIETIANAERIPFLSVEDGYPRNITNSLSSTIINDYIRTSNSITLQPINLTMKLGGKAPGEVLNGFGNHKLSFDNATYLVIELSVTNPQTSVTQTKKFFASFASYSTAKQYIYGTDLRDLTESNFIKMTPSNIKIEYIMGQNSTIPTPVFYYDVVIPLPSMYFEYGNSSTNGIVVTRTVSMRNYRNMILCTASCGNKNTTISIENRISTINQYKDYCFYTELSDIAFYRRWRDYIPISLSNIYFKEDAPLFDIILQYSKMFGLMWVPDYDSKVIKLMHKSTYFSDYSIVDWSDRLDRTKDFIIEPITFNSRYIAFNYEDTDGFRYTGYKDKYGVNYGNKTIFTGYDFGYETKDLFSGISPSSASSKSYVDLYQWYDWNLINKIQPTQTQISFIDCEDEDQKSSISIYNWYLRGKNITLQEPIYITNDSPFMIAQNEYCWMHPDIAIKNGLAMYSMPSFDIAINEPSLFPNLAGRTLGATFNTPTEDFTYSKLPTESLGNSLYNLFWEKYINERYNIQNKKVTAYFNLYPEDYNTFKFNRFVTVDNQLFIVNKITDFDLNAGGLTKVELIQVTEPQAYTDGSESFPWAVVAPNEVNIQGTTTQDANGRLALIAQITLFDEDGDLQMGTWGELSGTILDGMSIIFDKNTISNYVYVEGGDFEPNIGQHSIMLYWDNMSGKKFNGSISYTIGDKSFQIPIVIDYSVTI